MKISNSIDQQNSSISSAAYFWRERQSVRAVTHGITRSYVTNFHFILGKKPFISALAAPA
jgi:hypothetical protein